MNQKFKDILKKYLILPGYALFRKLPIKNDLILFESGVARNYSGNPRYIYEEMVRQGLDNEFRCVWIFEDINTPLPGNAEKVKRSRFKYYYYLAVAKIWVFDTRDPPEIIKRKEGYYLQTWHGTPLKKLGMDMDDVFIAGSVDINDYKRKFREDTRKWDFLLSQNDYSTQIFQDAFAFSGKYSPIQEIWNYGYPRNDVLTTHNQEDCINRLKNELGIPPEKKVLLYAPTWRDNQYHQRSWYKFATALDFNLLKEKLGNDHVILVKYHYLVKEDLGWADYEGFVYPFGANQDIAELYLVSDMLITDYSSVMFDFCILKRPILFFMYDLEEYRDELRGFYFDVLKEIPGPISKTTEELVEDIKNYDARIFEEKYCAFQEKYAQYDDGKAAQKVVHRILELKSRDKVAELIKRKKEMESRLG